MRARSSGVSTSLLMVPPEGSARLPCRSLKVWRQCDRGMQQPEPRTGAIDRGGPGCRLHAREPHRRPSPLRPFYRLHRQSFIIGLQTCVTAQGQIHHGGRIVRPLDRSAAAVFPRACIVTIRKPNARRQARENDSGGYGHHRRPYRFWKSKTGHRPQVPIK